MIIHLKTDITKQHLFQDCKDDLSALYMPRSLHHSYSCWAFSKKKKKERRRRENVWLSATVWTLHSRVHYRGGRFQSDILMFVFKFLSALKMCFSSWAWHWKAVFTLIAEIVNFLCAQWKSDIKFTQKCYWPPCRWKVRWNRNVFCGFLLFVFGLWTSPLMHLHEVG